MSSAFDAHWLANLEVISRVLFSSEQPAARETKKIDHFSVNFATDRVVFGAIHLQEFDWKNGWSK